MGNFPKSRVVFVTQDVDAVATSDGSDIDESLYLVERFEV